MPFYHWQGEDLLLDCHLQPGAKRAEFAGQHGERLKIRISAPPVDGKANQELLKTLASALGCKRAELSIAHGLVTGCHPLRICLPPRVHWPVIWGCDPPVCPSQRGSSVTPLKRRGSRPDWNQLTKVMMLNIGRPSA